MRKRIFDIIEVADEDDRVSTVYDGFMIVTIIASIIPMCFKQNTYFLKWIEWAAAGIFIIDYILRWFTADKKISKLGI